MAAMSGRNFVLAPVGAGKYVVRGRADIGIEFRSTEGKTGDGAHDRRQSQEYRFTKAAPLKALWAAGLAGYAGSISARSCSMPSTC